MLTVACVWVRGNVPYDVVYVERLQAMVRRHLPVPHRFVCLTDRPCRLPPAITACTITPVAPEGWWSKVQLFNPAHRALLGGRVLYLDLDVLVVGDLAPLTIDRAVPFLVAPDDGSAFQGARGRAVIKAFNTSVMAWDAGTYADLWTAWTPAVAARLWGDQDWLAERHPDAATYPAAWCPRLSAIGVAGVIPAAARVVLAKKPKPLEAAARWPWFAERWG